MNAYPFNFNNLEPFAKDIPHEALARLRGRAPVYWNPSPSTTRSTESYWLVTKYNDIIRIEKTPALFSSHFGLTISDAPPSNAGPPWSMVRDGLTHLDPPEHFAHRQIIAPLFTPRAIERMETRIRMIAIEVIDRACRARDVDFASEVALRFPVTVVLGEVLDLPPQDFERAVYWSDVIAAPNDPEFSRSAHAKVVEDLYNYALSIVAARRKRPGTDILSILAHTKTASGNQMSDEIFVRYFWSLLTGAFDTTASAISGGMLALIMFPEEHAKPCLRQSCADSACRGGNLAMGRLRQFIFGAPLRQRYRHSRPSHQRGTACVNVLRFCQPGR